MNEPMCTSTKRTRTNPARDMQHLQSKIADLQAQYQEFAKQREQDTPHLLNAHRPDCQLALKIDPLMALKIDPSRL